MFERREHSDVRVDKNRGTSCKFSALLFSVFLWSLVRNVRRVSAAVAMATASHYLRGRLLACDRLVIDTQHYEWYLVICCCNAIRNHKHAGCIYSFEPMFADKLARWTARHCLPTLAAPYREILYDQISLSMFNTYLAKNNMNLLDVNDEAMKRSWHSLLSRY